MDIIKLDEKRLVQRIKKGELEYLVTWINDRRDKLYKICWSYVYNHDDIEDIFQNTIIKIYENIASLKETNYFETWFISILINECRQNIRNNKREVLQENIELEGFYNDNYDFFQEINSIDEIYKEVIILKYISGYSQEEISKILGIPLGTVKSRIYRGLRDLRILLKEV
jgi:RNA polymerase sigma-70 factor (ECF subfamily)